MGVGSLPADDKVCCQNSKRHNDRDGSSEIPERHRFESGAQYHIRRECQYGGQKVSDGSDDRAPDPQENLNGRFVKQWTERRDDQEITMNPALNITPESAMPEMTKATDQFGGQ